MFSLYTKLMGRKKKHQENISDESVANSAFGSSWNNLSCLFHVLLWEHINL